MFVFLDPSLCWDDGVLFASYPLDLKESHSFKLLHQAMPMRRPCTCLGIAWASHDKRLYRIGMRHYKKKRNPQAALGVYRQW